MKNSILVICLFAGFVFGWHESFNLDATLDGDYITGDYTWGCYPWYGQEPYIGNGSLVLQGDHLGATDPSGLFSSWVQMDYNTDPNIELTPTDNDVFVKLKINSNGVPHEKNHFHLGVLGDPDFFNNKKAYTVGVGPAYGKRLGVFSLYDYMSYENPDTIEFCGWTFPEEENEAVVFDEFFWLRAKVDSGTDISIWAYPDGESCPATPDLVYTQDQVDEFMEALIMIAIQPADTSGGFAGQTIEISDVYYNEVPLDNNYQSSIVNYQLLNAYPNPFNPSTTISYQLPAPSPVLLTIYNVKGQLVETLVNSSSMQEAGYHQITWIADNHSSGLYFVQMTAGDFTQTQKLLFLK
ncbi:MAG: T9SS type A sorting domain-containing protein [Candidatus Marinimicrobia bacterium]|nr:T9SS type A sorting domain-containing protein [Candidatus Neomarinimicrobiota bacterium]MBL7023656.1 T9SS type A sorting domain-containing protein [Candidatus Neomarinimicrobiota bacterium]MBL7109880.1 T9SS type A sorting domain-containing protein [Candidatus Neomarinimicrobiota bacterium]